MLQLLVLVIIARKIVEYTRVGRISARAVSANANETAVAQAVISTPHLKLRQTMLRDVKRGRIVAGETLLIGVVGRQGGRHSVKMRVRKLDDPFSNVCL